MMEPMAEGHSLKSSGQVTCQGQQMFYELILINQQHMIRFYDCLGRMRLTRPIKLPAQSLEIHGVGEYLLCYETPAHGSAHGTFYLVYLSNLRKQTQAYIMDLNCSPKERQKIRHVYCNIDKRIIIFSDADQNLYILRIFEKDYEIKFVYKHDQTISSLSLNELEQVVVINQNEGISLLSLEEIELTLEKKDDEPNVVNYYRGDGFIVHYTKYRDWRNHEDRVDDDRLQNYYLLINNEGEGEQLDFQMNRMDKFFYQLPKDSQIIIKSASNYLIVFNKTNNLIFSNFNGLQRVTPIADSLMSQIEHNNFLIHFKTDECFNVLLEIRVFVKMCSTFTLYEYQITKKDGVSHKNYLKRNLHNIFQLNGLILPLYERQVHKQLNRFIISLDEFKSSKESRISSDKLAQNQPDQETINPYELGVKLLKISYQFFPNNLDKIISKIKANANKNTFYIEETHRFFEYSHFILEEYIDVFIGIAESIQNQAHVNSFLKSKDKDQLLRITTILENMIAFLFGLINTLKIELIDDENQKKATQFKKVQQQKISYYESVYNMGRSFFLIAKMLQDEDIPLKFEHRLKTVEEHRQKFREIWQLNNQLLKLDYEPLFLHEHFSNIALLVKQEQHRFLHLIKYLLANRQHFLQNAYFYQLITKNSSTPYLQTDVCDLLENICFHLPLMKKDTLYEQNEFHDTKILLYKMTVTVLKLKCYPFMKYMIQLNVFYEEYSLAIMLIFSSCFRVPGGFQVDQKMKKEHLFAIKSLVLSNRTDLAQLYVLDHYNHDIFEQFIKLARINGNIPEILELNEKEFILSADQEALKQLLQIEERKWAILFGQKGSESISNEKQEEYTAIT